MDGQIIDDSIAGIPCKINKKPLQNEKEPAMKQAL